MSEALVECLAGAQYDRARAVSYVALDVPSADEALGLVEQFGDSVDGYKIGLELFHRAGPDVVRRVADLDKRIFLDVKLHDIPNTVAGALRAISTLPVEVVNVHALGGRNMLLAAREAVSQSRFGTRLIAVTVLTSLQSTDLRDVGLGLPAEEAVLALAQLANDCGLNGVVASAQEAGMIRSLIGRNFDIVVPGTRPAWAEAHDQKRTATPGQALRAGASHLVLGRVVTQGDILLNLKRVWDELLTDGEVSK